VITYQEAIAPQIITHDTDVTSPSVQLPSGIGNCKQVLYHAAKNSLFIAADDTTNGGVFVVNLTAHTVTRIHTETASGPQIWDNRVVTIDISPDGNLLAVGGVNGIDVIDISNPSISNWDINTTGKALRTASTPALRINPIYRVRWDSDSDTLFFSYADQSVATCWGGKYVLSTDTLTDLIYAGTLNHHNIDFIIRPSGLVSCMIASGHNTIVTTSKTTGANVAATTLDAPDTSSGLGISYDDVNDEYLVQTQSSLIRVSTGLSVLETFSATSTPAAPIDNTLTRVELAGKGIMYEHLHRPTWYSFKDQKPYGHLFGYAAGIGENYNFTVLGWGTNIGNWASYPSAGGAFFVNTVDIGRIRYGFFSYNSATKQLITSGVDFYDACNSNKVGTNLTSLRFPRITRDINDALYMYFSRMDLGLATNCLSPVIGVVVPDVVKLSLKATIRNTEGSFIQSRARIKKTIKREDDDGLQMRASIRFAQCLKIRARIVPRSSQGMTMKATIYGWQQSTGVTGSFLIRAEQQTSARLRFWVATGYTRARTMQLGAYIVRESTVRCTGRFIISANPTGALNPTFNVVQRGQQSLGLRASIGG
jgi:hypothetical protein